MIAQTDACALDGRPLIEVYGVERSPDVLELHGTAVAFEATVILDLIDGEGRIRQSVFVTATAGAPDRGTWTATVEVERAASDR